MKKYEKPTLEIVQLRVSENIALKPGNTTQYNMNDEESFVLGTLGLDGGGLS